jgi:hypothetical protein
MGMTQKIGDPAENHVAYNPEKKFYHGWTVERWIQFVAKNPDCTLPGGIGRAIIAYYETRHVATNVLLGYPPSQE